MRRTKLCSTAGLDLDVKKVAEGGLVGRFIFPPFSVFRAYSKEWQRRKRQWIALGIESEKGRKAKAINCNINYDRNEDAHLAKITGLTFRSSGWMAKILDERGGGTSIFDPVLCELMYLWFCPKNGQIIDPFAGGSVRGIVASVLGFRYWGCDLRQEQVGANIIQAKRIVPDNQPDWVCGDSRKELKNAPQADFLFSCPPYGDLEVYSDIDGDLSNIHDYGVFVSRYSKIVKKACMKLKQNSFACFVVANFRDKKSGLLHDFVGDTITSFESAGVHFYNDAVLLTSIGSLPVRTGRQFSASRKLGKAHQYVLIFYKGDVAQIKDKFGDTEYSDV